MIMFGSFLPSLLVGLAPPKSTRAVGADIVMESITLTIAKQRRKAPERCNQRNDLYNRFVAVVEPPVDPENV